MKDFDDFMKKIDYLTRIDPRTIHPPLNQLGKPIFPSSHKPISKEKVRQDLLKKGREEIEQLYNEEMKRLQMENEREEKERFFNQPSYDADFNYWGKQPYWTIDEATFLILGKEPRKIKWENIQQYANVSTFAKKFEEIRDLAKRYIACGQLSDSVIPGVFLAWVNRMGFDIPNQLQVTVDKLSIQITDWQFMCKKAVEQIDEKDKIITQLKKENEQLKTDMETISISSRSEDTYLTILGIILKTMFSTTTGGQKMSCFMNQSNLIEYLADNYSSFRGISKSTLEDKFAKANKKVTE